MILILWLEEGSVSDYILL